MTGDYGKGRKLEAVVDEIEGLVHALGKALAGRSPAVQGAVLADLTAIWLAGHLTDVADETRALRDRLLTAHIDKVRELVPVNAKIMGHD